MAEHKSVRLRESQLDALRKMAEDGQAEDESKALRMALDIGLRELGYELNGEKIHDDSGLVSWAAGEGVKAFSYIGVAWLLMSTVAFPYGFRMGALGAFMAAVACVGLAWVAGRANGRLPTLWGENA